MQGYREELYWMDGGRKNKWSTGEHEVKSRKENAVDDKEVGCRAARSDKCHPDAMAKQAAYERTG